MNLLSTCLFVLRRLFCVDHNLLLLEFGFNNQVPIVVLLLRECIATKFAMAILNHSKVFQCNAVYTFLLFIQLHIIPPMSERNMPIEPVHLTELIRNPVIVRIVRILDLASLSIFELLEYNLERREINYAMSEGVIAIDKTIDEPTSTSSSSSQFHTTEMMQEDNILIRGDSFFFEFLNSKVRLTELGLYILDSIREDLSKKELPVNQANQFDLSSFNPPTRP